MNYTKVDIAKSFIILLNENILLIDDEKFIDHLQCFIALSEKNQNNLLSIPMIKALNENLVEKDYEMLSYTVVSCIHFDNTYFAYLLAEEELKRLNIKKRLFCFTKKLSLSEFIYILENDVVDCDIFEKNMKNVTRNNYIKKIKENLSTWRFLYKKVKYNTPEPIKILKKYIFLNNVLKMLKVPCKMYPDSDLYKKYLSCETIKEVYDDDIKNGNYHFYVTKKDEITYFQITYKKIIDLIFNDDLIID